MSLFISIVKIVIIMCIFYNISTISIKTGKKSLKWIYIVACLDEIVTIGNSEYLYNGTPEVGLNLFLFLLLLMTIPEIHRNNVRFYIIYILILTYAFYYYFAFSISYREYPMNYRFMIEVIRYLTKLGCIFIVYYFINNSVKNVKTNRYWKIP